MNLDGQHSPRGGDLFNGIDIRGIHGSPDAPFIWPLDGDLARTDTVSDIGSHVVSFADHLVGEVEEITAHCPVVFKERPEVEGAAYGCFSGGRNTGRRKAVTNPDLGMVLCRFKSGGVATIDFSRVATGRRFM